MVILFHEFETLGSFLYPLSSKYNFKKMQNANDEFSSYHCWKDMDNDIEIRYAHINIDELKYFLDYCDIFVTDVYSMYDNAGDTSVDTFDRYVIPLVKSGKLKVIVMDNQGETIEHIKYHNAKNWDKLLYDLTQRKNLYTISQRGWVNSIEDKITTGHQYLSLLYYYFHLSDNLYFQPTITPFENKNKTYDFITYKGLKSKYANEWERSQNAWRDTLIDAIEFGDKKLFTPQSYNDRQPIQDTVKDMMDFPNGNFGSYNWFSLLESEQARIKIVLESQPPEVTNTHESKLNFLTEKTLKCFLHNQPYFLIMKEQLKKYLRDYGFRFVETDNYAENINYISNLCKEDIDEWVTNNKPIFNHNKDLMYKMIFDSELPHIKFLEKIINTK
jgi:hypothetical protein